MLMHSPRPTTKLKVDFIVIATLCKSRIFIQSLYNSWIYLPINRHAYGLRADDDSPNPLAGKTSIFSTVEPYVDFHLLVKIPRMVI